MNDPLLASIVYTKDALCALSIWTLFAFSQNDVYLTNYDKSTAAAEFKNAFLIIDLKNNIMEFFHFIHLSFNRIIIIQICIQIE